MERKNSKQEESSGFNKLMTIVEEIGFFHTPEGDCYATFEVDGHREVWPLDSKEFRNFVFSWFFEKYERPPGGQDFRDFMSILEHKAKKGKERKVYTRIARVGNSIYLDLCDKK